MGENRYHQLVKHAYRKAGDQLRVVGGYDVGNWRTLYRRKDLQDGDFEQRVEEVHDHARKRQELTGQASREAFGSHECGLEVHEDAVLIFLREDGDRGVVISLEKEAARDLAQFVVECRETLTRSVAERSTD